MAIRPTTPEACALLPVDDRRVRVSAALNNAAQALRFALIVGGDDVLPEFVSNGLKAACVHMDQIAEEISE